MSNIILNGKPHAVAERMTITGLLEELGLAGKRLAVERNRSIVPRSAHATTVLVEGDVVEIVQAIGGG